MLFKRLAANLIDGVFFWFVYFVSSFVTSLEPTGINSAFLLFFAFVVIVILPVLIVNNTFGKIILNIHWSGEEEVKPKLLIKYFVYFLSISPYLNLSSAVMELLPKISTRSSHNILSSGIFSIAFICSDIIVFLISWGKYHITDYFLGLSIKGKPYNTSGWKLLSITYLFSAIFLYSSAQIVRSNFLAENLELRFKNIFFDEQFPQDLFYGANVSVSRDHNNHVFAPSDPLSFLYETRFDQKTLFVMLPYSVFQSLEARKKICNDLLEQSWKNDIFNQYKPRQVKILLATYRLSPYFFSHNYYRVYYFDPKMPRWGVYGGIKTDSTIIKKYLNFLKRYTHESTLDIEQKLHMPFQKILAKIKKDTILRAAFINANNLKFKFASSTTWMDIQLYHAVLHFEKFNFEDAPLYEDLQFNFPIENLQQPIYFSLFGNRFDDADQAIQYLIQGRKIANDILN